MCPIGISNAQFILEHLQLSIYSSQMTLVTCPGISISATNSPKVPSSTFRSTITTLESSCKPTAASVPALFTENWRGNEPPAGESCLKVSFPVYGLMAQLWRVSDGILVLFVGSKLGIENSVALREEVSRNLPSGCNSVKNEENEGRE